MIEATFNEIVSFLEERVESLQNEYEAQKMEGSYHGQVESHWRKTEAEFILRIAKAKRDKTTKCIDCGFTIDAEWSKIHNGLCLDCIRNRREN